jgi:3-(3-hydroxy-phenyl)propionate hydroxylase
LQTNERKNSMNSSSYTNAQCDVDVLIVGLGPVGAALCNLLGRYDVKALAIDAAKEVLTHPRAIALDNEALRILQLAGVAEGELPMVGIPQVQYHSPLFGRFAKINSAGVVDGHPMLITFYQPELERLLRSKLSQYQNIEIRLGVKLKAFEDQGDHIQATVIDSQGVETQIYSRYIVGADGANSFVRQALGLEFEGQTFQQDWLIVDALNVPNSIDHCEFICDPKRPTPHMVAPGNRQRWEFMLHPGEDREAMLNPESIEKLLTPWCDVKKITIERTAVYRFQAREARSFSKGRGFLVGDAAHITPPFAGQGLVAGLRDVSNLAWKLSWVLKGRASSSILQSYDQERRPHAKKIINLARFLGALVMPSNRLAAFCIHGFMSSLRLLPKGRAFMEDLKIKPENTFDDGLFTRNKKNEKLRAGSTLAQGWVRPSWDQKICLSDDALGMGWTLIGFGKDPTPYLNSEEQERWRAFGGTIRQWTQRAQGLHLGPIEQRFEALDEAILPRKAPIGWACIVRPDRCVFAEGPIENTALLLKQATDLISPR